MGIAEKYGIEVWRWREGKWRARHHDGSMEYKTPQEMGNNFGRQKGDWLVERLRSGRATYIPQDDMFATGTLWYFDGTDWKSIYRRRAGRKRPDYLDEIRDHGAAKQGDVLVESGQNDELTAYDSNGVRYTYGSEIAAVVDERSPDERPFDGSIISDAPRERQVEEDLERVAVATDKVISARKNLAAIGSEWAGWKEGDPVTTKMAKVLLKAIEEANPSPTPGTTAINDYVGLASDIATGKINSNFYADGIDSEGAAVDSSGNEADAAIADIAVCKMIGETLAGCGAVVDYVAQLHKMATAENLAPGTKTGGKQYDGERKTALASAELDAGKIVSNLFNATDKAINLADKTCDAASATSTVATTAVAPFAVVLNALVFARHSRKAHRARKRWWQYRGMLKKSKTEPYCDDLQHCLHYFVGKSGRRTRTQAATATGAVIGGTGSGILAVTAIVGGANAWNPVGWVLLGTAAVGGAGIVGYKLYKRWSREKRHAKRAVKWGGVTDEATATRRLIGVYKGGPSDRDQEAAGLILTSFGVVPEELNGNPATIDAAVAMVTRHLRG